MEEAAGRLKVVHVGRKWLVRPSDLEAWLEARANEPRRTESEDDSANRPETAEEPVDRPELPRRTQSPGVEHSEEKSEFDPSEPIDREIETVNQGDPPSQFVRSREMVAVAKSQV
jgi:hypothetical protein